MNFSFYLLVLCINKNYILKTLKKHKLLSGNKYVIINLNRFLRITFKIDFLYNLTLVEINDNDSITTILIVVRFKVEELLVISFTPCE